MELVAYGAERLARLLPFPSPDDNKYTRGQLTCIVGSAAYTGAACLSACAAERMGAGYTRVLTDPSAVPLVRQASPSLVVAPFDAFDPLEVLAPPKPGHPRAILVGCGFEGRGSRERDLLSTVLAGASCPVCADGGALRLLAEDSFLALLDRPRRDGFALALTPHGGEAARLAAPFGIPTDDGAELALRLARAYGAAVAVKGPRTFVSDGRAVALMDEGTAVLAKAGTGDVLAGMVGALLSRGISPMDACVLGCTLHARAGRAAEEALTSVCATAGDLPRFIADAVRATAGR